MVIILEIDVIKSAEDVPGKIGDPAPYSESTALEQQNHKNHKRKKQKQHKHRIFVMWIYTENHLDMVGWSVTVI